MINIKKEIPNILVIGDLIIDHYLWGKCERISPEAPVQILNVDRENSVLGGAGNVINNLKAFGTKVEILSVIGNDLVGNELKFLLEEIGVKSDNLIIEEDRKTSKKSRLIASQQQVLRYDNESIQDINKNSEISILENLKKKIKSYDAIILSDYAKGVLTKTLTKEIINIANKNKIKVFADPKGKDYSKYTGAFTLTPNKNEAIEATGIKIIDNKSIETLVKKLKDDYKLEISLVTLSENGIAIFDNNLRIKPTVAKEVYDVTGAGDTVIAAITFAIVNNNTIDQAVEFANLAAGVVVGKIGSATASINEIYDYKNSITSSSSVLNIKSQKEIEDIIKKLKQKDKKIVFTNGCFDILHAGHVKYLETARNFGDILIVGLNSDNSVKKIKGNTRPINNQEDRAYILSSLKSVDYVVIFNEETPFDLISAIKPHILVKGGDYKDKKVIGQDIVDELKLVDFIEGKSTTSTIQRIKDSETNN